MAHEDTRATWRRMPCHGYRGQGQVQGSGRRAQAAPILNSFVLLRISPPLAHRCGKIAKDGVRIPSPFSVHRLARMRSSLYPPSRHACNHRAAHVSTEHILFSTDMHVHTQAGQDEVIAVPAGAPRLQAPRSRLHACLSKHAFCTVMHARGRSDNIMPWFVTQHKGLLQCPPQQPHSAQHGDAPCTSCVGVAACLGLAAHGPPPPLPARHTHHHAHVPTPAEGERDGGRAARSPRRAAPPPTHAHATWATPCPHLPTPTSPASGRGGLLA